MPTSDNIYTALNDELKSFEHRKDVDVVRLIAIANARAQVDQAISLASIADSLDQLVEALRRPMTPDQKRRAEAAQQAQIDALTGNNPRGIASEHDVEVGDLVSPFGGPGEVQQEVTEVGIDQGQLWLKLDGAPVKVWASQFVVVERATPSGPVPAAIPTPAELKAFDDGVNSFDDLDEDFATDTGDADEQQADALAKLREKQGKSKPKGKR